MTTATAELCGHRWPQVVGDGWWHGDDHRCTEPADHPPYPHGHRCRCGATTWRRPMTTTDPTAPATPAIDPVEVVRQTSGDFAEPAFRRVRADALRQAAERVNELMGSGTDLGATLRHWADELDAARATDPAPATPPEHQPGTRTYELPDEPPPEVTELWDKDGDRWDRYDVHGGWSQDDGTPGSVWPWKDLVAAWGPLSTTPPAGTEPDENGGPYFVTATDSPPRPPASDYARCRWCSEAIANRAGRWEHLGEPCAGSPVEPLPASATAVDLPAGTVWP